MKKYFSFAMTLLALSSCGPSSEDSTLNKQLEDYTKNRQVYAQFVGFYRGEVEPVNPPEDRLRKRHRLDEPKNPKYFSKMVPVELQINIIEVPNGVDSSGRTIFRPELRGSYVRTDIDEGIVFGARRPLILNYQAETNTLLMAHSDSPPVSGPNKRVWEVAINATYSGGHIEGSISYGGNTTGILRMDRASPELE